MPSEAAEEFGVFGHAAHLNLKEGKANLETAIVFVVIVEKTFHEDAPLCWAGSCIPGAMRRIDEHRQHA